MPLGALALVAAKFAHVIDPEHGFVVIVAAVFLLGAVFSAVHHAEVVAVKVGEPFGSILLAVAVTVIEVALIVSMMASATNGNTDPGLKVDYGADVCLKFAKAGTFTFVCTTHGFVGTVTVQ